MISYLLIVAQKPAPNQVRRTRTQELLSPLCDLRVLCVSTLTLPSIPLLILSNWPIIVHDSLDAILQYEFMKVDQQPDLKFCKSQVRSDLGFVDRM